MKLVFGNYIRYADKHSDFTIRTAQGDLKINRFSVYTLKNIIFQKLYIND